MKRKVGIGLIIGAALPLLATSIAWACGVLATAKVSNKVVAPGGALTVTGKNYSTSATASAVTVRLSKRSGDVLATTAPNSAGAISTTFNMPSNLSPGWYVIQVLQFNANGTPKSGTPGRATVRVQGSAAAAATPWSGNGPSGPASFATDTGSGSLLPMLAAIALSLTMLAGGWTLVARKGRLAPGAPLAT